MPAHYSFASTLSTSTSSKLAVSTEDSHFIHVRMKFTSVGAADGDLLICGSNENSQLGWNPARPPSHVSIRMEEGVPLLTTPTRVATLDAYRVHHAVMGLSHAVAVAGEGQPYTWGVNDLGELGRH